MDLTVLGSSSPYPRPGNPCSGYLISSAGTRVWVDAGTGTLAELQRHTPLDAVDAIWISHLHADHCADLLTAYYALLYADIRLTAPIPLYGPPGLADRLAGFLTNSPERSPVERAFAFHDLYDGHSVQIGPLSLTSGAVEHGMPAFALRVDEAGNSLVYSGDSSPCDGLTALATGCTTLLCEADLNAPEFGHHTPEQAATTAAAARAERLILTHVGPHLSARDAVDRAAAHYSGPVDHASPGRTFSLS